MPSNLTETIVNINLCVTVISTPRTSIPNWSVYFFHLVLINVYFELNERCSFFFFWNKILLFYNNVQMTNCCFPKNRYFIFSFKQRNFTGAIEYMEKDRPVNIVIFIHMFIRRLTITTFTIPFLNIYYLYHD